MPKELCGFSSDELLVSFPMKRVSNDSVCVITTVGQQIFSLKFGD